MIAEALSRYQVPRSRVEDVGAIKDCLWNPDTLRQPKSRPRWILATDSSPFEHVVDRDFPSTRLVFTQMSAVMVDLQEMQQRVGPFVNPAAIRDAHRATVMAAVLPGSNLLRSDGTPPMRAFREAIDELLRTRQIEGRSLFDVLVEVQRYRGDPTAPAVGAVPRCPNPLCKQRLTGTGGGELLFDVSGTVCPQCTEPILFTDLLRAHEAFREFGENGEACGRVMSVAERLISLGFLDHVHTRLRGTLSEIALVTDGPLALFGEVAKLKTGILRRMQAVAAELSDEGLRLPVIVGIEKSGVFVEHARAIRQHIPEGMLMIPDRDYVERYITFRGSPHGSETYYGRHVFYRSRDRRMHVLTVPPLGRNAAEPHDEFDPADYPTLACTCALIDAIGTRLYDDATIPLVLAHRYAAFPVETAGQVLKLFVEENLAEGSAHAA